MSFLLLNTSIGYQCMNAALFSPQNGWLLIVTRQCELIETREYEVGTWGSRFVGLYLEKYLTIVPIYTALIQSFTVSSWILGCTCLRACCYVGVCPHARTYAHFTHKYMIIFDWTVGMLEWHQYNAGNCHGSASKQWRHASCDGTDAFILI